jgi:hypothetical protein
MATKPDTPADRRVVSLVAPVSDAQWMNEEIIATLEDMLELARTRPISGLSLFLIDEQSKVSWVKALGMSTTTQIGAHHRIIH